MVEDVDFRLSWPGFDWRLLGRRLITINLSDLAAMGAQPRHALVSLALRGDLRQADVDRLYAGIAEQAGTFGCTIAGGDLSATSGPLMLTAAVVGSVPSASKVLKREGAKPGWCIAVTGRLGGAAAGLRLLEKGQKAKTPSEKAWVRAQLDPVPRLAAAQALVEAGVRVAGDISDGLYHEVERILERTGLGATVDLTRLPLAKRLEQGEWRLALQDSEDFELVCAAPAPRIEAARKVIDRAALELTVIGEIEREPGIRLKNGSRIERLDAAGYEHFR